MTISLRLSRADGRHPRPADRINPHPGRRKHKKEGLRDFVRCSRRRPEAKSNSKFYRVKVSPTPSDCAANQVASGGLVHPLDKGHE